MTDDEAPIRALVKVSDQTLAPARSLAERTLAELRSPGDQALSVPRRLIVAADGSAMFTTIGAAIAIAVDGDEIIVEPGHYFEYLTINLSIRITGHGPRDKIVLEGPTSQVPSVTVTGSAPTLSGFSIGSRHRVLGQILFQEPTTWRRCIEVTSGQPTLDSLDLTGLGGGVAISGGGTGGLIRSCLIRGGSVGITVEAGAQPIIENNDICGWEKIGGTLGTGLDIRGLGSSPSVRMNRIHHVGIGMRIGDGADPRVEENDISANGQSASFHAGVQIFGSLTAPTISANRIHSGKGPGVIVSNASPLIQDNEIWANELEGLRIKGSQSSPKVIGNEVHDGYGDGIAILDGARPTIHNNTLKRNAGRQLHIAEDAVPVVGTNFIST